MSHHYHHLHRIKGHLYSSPGFQINCQIIRFSKTTPDRLCRTLGWHREVKHHKGNFERKLKDFLGPPLKYFQSIILPSSLQSGRRVQSLSKFIYEAKQRGQDPTVKLVSFEHQQNARLAIRIFRRGFAHYWNSPGTEQKPTDSLAKKCFWKLAGISAEILWKLF